MNKLLRNTNNAFGYKDEFSVDKKLLKKRYHTLLKKKNLSKDDKEDLALCELLIMDLKGKPDGTLVRFDDNGFYVKW